MSSYSPLCMQANFLPKSTRFPPRNPWFSSNPQDFWTFLTAARWAGLGGGAVNRVRIAFPEFDEPLSPFARRVTSRHACLQAIIWHSRYFRKMSQGHSYAEVCLTHDLKVSDGYTGFVWE